MNSRAQSAYSSVPAVNMTISKWVDMSFRKESAPGLMDNYPSLSLSYKLKIID